ncbi:FG-GAP repeat domain-containing protein [Dyadobacter tibetensis]|uniref:FG-GAP repeat domain-containing protein n=1 Tax=Dyadobacter tibetensis TaxID=1211851 RepID=UPI000471ACE4|nr:VCBS repeat-containing protein [Dyadobacter tibetensis]
MKYLFLALLLVTASAVIISCGTTDNGRPMKEEFALVEKYCGNCHLTPEPAQLDKATWKNRVLPAMALRLGLEVWEGVVFARNEPGKITHGEWMKIEAYFDSLAPRKLDHRKVQHLPESSWAIFQLQTPLADQRIATTTMVAFEPDSPALFSSDGETGTLRKWDLNLRNMESVSLPTPASFMSFDVNKQAVLTCIGNMMARDNNQGSILTYTKDNQVFQPIATEVNRPIHTSPIDANRDGKMDYLVCNFGHEQGGLYLWLQKEHHQYERILIKGLSGATQTIVGDFNADGWPDIMALFAHADESIWVFTNNKDNSFSSRRLLRFPAVYGSSSFQLVDMNDDGLQDIIYTAGDNSDHSRILKPYHGLYIFGNRGNFNMEQIYFYPINGSTKAIAKDFDLDGDIDIATIAFFADLNKKPEEKFLYFENKSTKDGVCSFTTHAPPLAKAGRWICMDVADFDGDGDQDIVLGNFSKGFLNEPGTPTNWNTRTPFVLLENKVK